MTGAALLAYLDSKLDHWGKATAADPGARTDSTVPGAGFADRPDYTITYERAAGVRISDDGTQAIAYGATIRIMEPVDGGVTQYYFANASEKSILDELADLS